MADARIIPVQYKKRWDADQLQELKHKAPKSKRKEASVNGNITVGGVVPDEHVPAKVSDSAVGVTLDSHPKKRTKVTRRILKRGTGVDNDYMKELPPLLDPAKPRGYMNSNINPQSAIQRGAYGFPGFGSFGDTSSLAPVSSNPYMHASRVRQRESKVGSAKKEAKKYPSPHHKQDGMKPSQRKETLRMDGEHKQKLKIKGIGLSNTPVSYPGAG